MNHDRRLLPDGVAIAAATIVLLLSFWLDHEITPTTIASVFLIIVVTIWHRGNHPENIVNENTDRLTTALNAAQMGMWDWDMVTGEIRWTPEHEQLFGLSLGSFDGRYQTFDACLHPDDRVSLTQALDRSLQERIPYHHEFRVVWADGSVHWIEGRGQASYDNAGQPVYMSGTVMAIDARKQAQLLLSQQLEQQRLVMEITQRIRQSLNLQDILQTTVDEVRQFLRVDRVIIFRFLPDGCGVVAVESCATDQRAILSTKIHDPCFQESYIAPFEQGEAIAKSDIYAAGISDCHLKLLENFQVRANLVVPILQEESLWGLLIAHHCQAPRPWQDSEIELLRQIASQVSLALQQSALLEQVQAELNERKQAEAQLQNLSDRLTLAIRSGAIGIWDWDVPHNILTWDDRMYELYGITPDRFANIYAAWASRLHPDDRPLAEGAIQQALQGERDYDPEFRVVHPDGTIRVIKGYALVQRDAQGNPQHMIGINLDITERKQAEEALRQSEQRYRSLFESIDEGFCVVEMLFDETNIPYDYRFLETNPAFDQQSGLAQAVGKTARQLVPNLEDHWFEILGNVALTGESLRFENGSESMQRWFDLYAFRFGQPSHRKVAILFKDITERQKTELALQSLNAGLEQRVAERTEELTILNDRLLSSVIELQRLQQETEDLYNNAPCGYHSLDINGVLIRINNTELKWLGYRRDEVLHKLKLVDLISPNSRAVFEQHFSQFLHQGSVNNLECELCHKDGSTRWVSLNGTAIRDQSGQFIMSRSTLFDISDRKQAEATLQQQARQKQLLWTITQTIRQSLDLNVILNASVAEVRQLLTVDRAAVYRFQPDWSGDFIVEAVSEPWVKLVNPEVRKIWEDTHLQETQGGRFQNQETFVVSDIYAAGLHPCHIGLLEQFQAKAYAVAPIFFGATLWGLLAIYQNTTPRNWQAWEIELLQQIASQMAIAIQQSGLYSQLQVELQDRQQAAAVLREAERRWRSLLENVQLMVVGLDRAGTINYVNPFFLSLTKYTESDVLGKNWAQYFLPASNQEVVNNDDSAHHFYYQSPILTKSGEERLIAWNQTMLQDSAGVTIGTISIGEDITERQKIELIKNEFIGIVSHELRTPLMALQMSLGLLKTGIYAKKPEKAQRMIEIALIDTNRLVNLVNDILDLERLESGQTVLEKTVCSAADLMQQAVDGVQAIAAQQGIALNIAPTDATVWAAADPIIQTLTNLLSNAVKFSPDRSVIQLQATCQADMVLFQVGDQGRGIPADKLETIFGRFQQVDVSDSREKAGTGLGLSICRSIVERHNGKIWAESTLGKGSTFFFTLPMPTAMPIAMPAGSDL